MNTAHDFYTALLLVACGAVGFVFCGAAAIEVAYRHWTRRDGRR